MLELVRMLGEYKDDIVLVGGWVPELLFSKAQPRHIGSTDVDLAINHSTVGEDRYRTILEHLKKHGYAEGPQPFIFFRTVNVNGRDVKVRGFVVGRATEPPEKATEIKSSRTIKARKARGCDLAFEICQEVKIEGRLPTGGMDSVVARVAMLCRLRLSA